MVGAKELKTGATTMVLLSTQGEFLIPQLTAGEYQISAKKAGYQSGTSSLSISGRADVDIELGSLPAVPMAELSNADFNRFLPEAPGKRTLVAMCGYCHGVKTVFFQEGRSREKWAELLRELGAGTTPLSGPVGHCVKGRFNLEFTKQKK